MAGKLWLKGGGGGGGDGRTTTIIDEGDGSTRSAFAFSCFTFCVSNEPSNQIRLDLSSVSLLDGERYSLDERPLERPGRSNRPTI